MNASSVGRKLPVIHIGMPKTATKTLQWRLFSRHSEVFYLGRFDGKLFNGNYRQFLACRDHRVMQLMDEIAYTGFRYPDLEKCSSLLSEYLAQENQKDLVPVWSWESYSTDSRRNRELRARNLKEVFGRAKIIINIRHPVKLLESAFLQQLKRDNVGAGYRLGRGIFFGPIDQWVEMDFGSNISNHLDYAETIRIYVEQFGVENVHVLLFEHLVKDKTAFLTQLCGIMNINPAESLGLVQEHVDNRRWTNIQLDRLKTIKSSFWNSLKFRFSGKRGRKEMLDLARNGAPRTQGGKAVINISPELQDKILERTDKGNRWLDQIFNLGLQELGYMKK